jgi:hypothetical protein
MQEAEAAFAQAAKDSLLIKYRQYLMCKVEQRAYLRRGHEGVCFAFCMDWVSRKLHPHRLKASYLEPKKQGGSSGSPDLSTERMTKKVTGRLMPLQHVYESIRGPESRVGDVLPQALKGYKGAHPECYRTLKVESVVPRTFVVGRQDVPDSSQGEEVFREIVGRCGKTPVVPPSLVLLNESIAKHKADPKMKHWVEEWQRLAQKQGPVRQPAAERAYIIGLEGRRGAHAIAISIDSQKKQIKNAGVLTVLQDGLVAPFHLLVPALAFAGVVKEPVCTASVDVAVPLAACGVGEDEDVRRPGRRADPALSAAAIAPVQLDPSDRISRLNSQSINTSG